MEGLEKKLDRIIGDTNQLIELYDYAEQLYPYQRIREFESTVTFLQIMLDS